MCSVTAGIIGGIVGGLYQHQQASRAADEARAAQERQAQLAREQAAAPVQHSQTNQDVTAAVQQNRARAAEAFNMDKTVTGVGTDYSLTPGKKSKLGM